MHLALHLLRLVRALAADGSRPAPENLALRQQLAVLKRSIDRPALSDGDSAARCLAALRTGFQNRLIRPL